ncbi:MAG TPA: acyl carrier protein [Ornithinibacter sp.]|nr:acyl carrier protein [Ornithinibacter sp.]
MSQTLTDQQARDAVAAAVLRIVPDAEVDTLDDDEAIRDAFELDSMDFLSLVELLSTGSGARIDESDYPMLTTMADCVEFLTRRTA